MGVGKDTREEKLCTLLDEMFYIVKWFLCKWRSEIEQVISYNIGDKFLSKAKRQMKQDVCLRMQRKMIRDYIT